MATNKSVSIEANSLQGFAVEVKARQFSMLVDQPADSGGAGELIELFIGDPGF